MRGYLVDGVNKYVNKYVCKRGVSREQELEQEGNVCLVRVEAFLP